MGRTNYKLQEVIDLFSEHQKRELVSLSHLNDLLNGEMYFNQLENYNDPFEPLLHVNKRLVDAFIKEGKKYSQTLKKRLQLVKEDRSIGKNALFNYAEMWRYYGVYCLCKEWDNHQMWAHYANSGNGVCIEYEIHDDLDDCYKSPNHRKLIPIYEDATEKNCEIFFNLTK